MTLQEITNTTGIVAENTVANAVTGGFVLTDYAKSCLNTGLMARIRLPYYKDDGSVAYSTTNMKNKDNQSDWLTGFLVDGFGWSISNTYEDLLSQTEDQKKWSKIFQGTSYALQTFTPGFIANTGWARAGMNKAMMSLQQTISIWLSMNKPSFSVNLLFFDGMGEDRTSITRVAYIIERSQYPYINSFQAPVIQTNMFMSAPGGYLPSVRNMNRDGEANKTYSLSAEGLAQLRIGTYAFFPEVICTGANLKFSDKILSNGKPQWLEATLNFTMWKQPQLEDLKYRYV